MNSPTDNEPDRDSIYDLFVAEEMALADAPSKVMTATGWQAHSIRGFISGSLGKKMGIAVESFKQENGIGPIARSNPN